MCFQSKIRIYLQSIMLLLRLHHHKEQVARSPGRISKYLKLAEAKNYHQLFLLEEDQVI